MPGNLAAARSELMLRPVRRLTRQRLRFLVASWDRWCEWLAKEGLSDQAYTPNTTTLGLYLAATASMGPTAFVSLFRCPQGYRWVVGVPFLFLKRDSVTSERRKRAISLVQRANYSQESFGTL